MVKTHSVMMLPKWVLSRDLRRGEGFAGNNSGSQEIKMHGKGSEQPWKRERVTMFDLSSVAMGWCKVTRPGPR